MIIMIIRIIIITRAPSCKLHEERPFMHSRTKEDACLFAKADPASDIQRRPIREAAWLRNLEQLRSILQESSKRFRRERAPSGISRSAIGQSIVGRSGIAAVDAKPNPKSSQNHKKSSQTCSRDGTWGTQNQLKITPGTFSGCPMVPKSVRKAPGECLGSIMGCPRRAPGAPGGSVKSTHNRAWSAQSSPGSVFQAILIACAV